MLQSESERRRGENNYRAGDNAFHQRESLRFKGSGKIGRPSFPPGGWQDSGQNFQNTYRCALKKEFSRSVNLRDAGLCKAQEITLLQDFLVFHSLNCLWHSRWGQAAFTFGSPAAAVVLWKTREGGTVVARQEAWGAADGATDPLNAELQSVFCGNINSTAESRGHSNTSEGYQASSPNVGGTAMGSYLAAMRWGESRTQCWELF